MNLIIISEHIANYIGLIGLLIISVGALRSVYEFIESYIKRIDQMTEIRIMLVKHLSLGLEFLVAKDIIDSILEPSLNRLAILGAIIVLRTAIAYVLHWELQQAGKYVAEETQLQEKLEEFSANQTSKKHKKRLRSFIGL